MTGIPEDHPLSEFEGDLDTHADHLEAYSQILADADADEVHGAMVVLYSSDGADTLPTVSKDVDPRFASLWMLGTHIHHVASSAQGAGGSATMEDVAADAIEYVRQHGFELDPDVRTDGGGDLDEQTTDSLVMLALENLDDQEADDGIPTGDVIDWILARTGRDRGRIRDTIDHLHKNGEIYEPCEDHLRRTEPEDSRWSA